MIIREFYGADGFQIGGALGVLPPAFLQPMKPGAAQVMLDRPISDGPHFWLGPFLLPVDIKDGQQIHLKFSQARRADFKNFIGFLSTELKKQSDRLNCGRIKKDGKWWAGSTVGGHCDTRAWFPALSDRPSREIPGTGVNVPPDTVWHKDFYTGKKPISRFKHPVTQKPWGLFMTIEAQGAKSSAGTSPGWFVLTMKPYNPANNIFSLIWNTLTWIVTKLINTIGDLLKSLLGIACQYAVPILQQPETQAAIAAASGQAAATAIGTAIIAAHCGTDAPASPPLVVEPSYRPGSVQAQNPTTKRWIVASPKLAGNLGGDTFGTSPEGEQYEVVDDQGAKVGVVNVISWAELQKWLKPPWYKSPWFWGATVVVLGTGSYVTYRVIKRRRA